jgi:hypothetical protein
MMICRKEKRDIGETIVDRPKWRQHASLDGTNPTTINNNTKTMTLMMMKHTRNTPCEL